MQGYCGPDPNGSRSDAEPSPPSEPSPPGHPSARRPRRAPAGRRPRAQPRPRGGRHRAHRPPARGLLLRAVVDAAQRARAGRLLRELRPGKSGRARSGGAPRARGGMVRRDDAPAPEPARARDPHLAALRSAARAQQPDARRRPDPADRDALRRHQRARARLSAAREKPRADARPDAPQRALDDRGRRHLLAGRGDDRAGHRAGRHQRDRVGRPDRGRPAHTAALAAPLAQAAAPADPCRHSAGPLRRPDHLLRAHRPGDRLLDRGQPVGGALCGGLRHAGLLALRADLDPDDADPDHRCVLAVDRARMLRVVRLAAELLAVGSFGALAFAVAAATPVVLLIFGPEYVSAAPALPVLGGAFVFICYGYLNGSLLTVMGLQQRLLRISLLALVVNVAGNLAFVPAFGFMGAAWMTLVTEVVVFGLSLRVILHNLELPLPSPGRIPRTLLAALLLGAGLTLLREVDASLAVLVPVACIVYPALLLGLGAVNLDDVRVLLRRAELA